MIALASAIKARIAVGSVSAQFRLALGLDPGITESPSDPRHSGSRRPGGIGGWCAAADGLHAGLVWPPLRSPTRRPIASYTLHLGQLRCLEMGLQIVIYIQISIIAEPNLLI